MQEHNFYAVIPTKILRDGSLKEKSKLLYADISSLCNQKGYCWASNEYFANLYGVREETISRALKEIEKSGYIKIDYKKRGAQITERIISILPLYDCENNQPTIDEKINRTIDEKVKDNNISINNININSAFESVWKLYPNKKGKGKVSDKAKKTLFDKGEEQIKRCIERYLKELKKDEWRHPQNGSTFFTSGYVDYLDENYTDKKEVKNSGYKSI